MFRVVRRRHEEAREATLTTPWNDPDMVSLHVYGPNGQSDMLVDVTKRLLCLLFVRQSKTTAFKDDFRGSFREFIRDKVISFIRF